MKTDFRRVLTLFVAGTAVMGVSSAALAQDAAPATPLQPQGQALVASGKMPAENIDGSKVNRGTQNEALRIVGLYNKALEEGNKEAEVNAVSSLSKLHDKDPVNLAALTWLGYIYTKQGDFNKAIPVIQPALGKSTSKQVNEINAKNLGACLYNSGQYAKSIPVLESLTAMSPDDAEAWSLLGSAHVLSNDYAGAVAPLKSARALLSDDKAGRQSVNTDLALSYVKSNQFESAFEIFSDMREIGGLSSTQLAWMGFTYLNNNRTDDAIVVLEQARSMDRNEPSVVNNLASAYLKRNGQGDKAKAKDMFVELVRLVPNNGTAAYNAGAIYLEEGDFQRAAEYLNRSVQNAQDPFAYNNLGRAYEGLGRSRDAAQNYAKASDLRPDNAMFAKNAGVTFNTVGDDANTVKYLERARANGEDAADVLVNLAGAYTRMGQTAKASAIMGEVKVQQAMADNADYWFNQGVSAQKAGRLKDAEDAYRKALGIRPDDIDALNNLGVLLFDSGDYRGALAMFEKLSGMESKSTNAKLNTAACYAKLGQLDGAIDIWKAVIRTDGSRNDVRIDLADALWNTGDLPGARFHYATVLKSDGNNARALNGMGLWHLLQSETKEAAASFERAIKSKKSFGPAYYNLAICYERLNRVNEAKKLLNDLLAMDPENDNAKKMLSRLNSGR